MRTLVIAGALLCAFGLQQAHAAGCIQVQLGQKSLNKDDWEPLESQGLFGFAFHAIGEQSSVGFIAQYLVSAKEDELMGVDVTGSTGELALGAYIPISSSSSAEWYGAGGLAFVAATLEGANGFAVIKDDDSATGFWAEGGGNFKLGEHLTLNASLRYSKATVELFDTDGEAGGLMFKAGLGYGF